MSRNGRDRRIEETSPFAIASRFNGYINDANLDGLASMMTDDHTFIDSVGSIVSGRERVTAAWRSFFKAFPDYRNVFAQHRTDGSVVAIAGRSICADSRLDGPALWRVVVRHDQIAQWRVYADTADNRLTLGLEAPA